MPATVLKFPTAAAKPAPSRARTPRRVPEPGERSLKFSDQFIKTACDASKDWPADERREWRDTEQPGLRVRIANGRATYSILMRHPGYPAPKRTTLGDNSAMNVKSARLAARQTIGEIDAGKDPTATKKGNREMAGVRGRSVASLLEEYMTFKTWRGRHLSEETGAKYKNDLLALLGDRFNQPVAKLDAETITRLYRIRAAQAKRADKRGVVQKLGSPVSAKVAVDALAAIFNFFDLPNLCRPLLKSGQVVKPDPKRARMSVEQAQTILPWLLAEGEARAGTSLGTNADQFVMTITMGLRIGSVQKLRWSWIDLKQGAAAVEFPAGELKSKREAMLPIPPRTAAMLRRRFKQRAPGCDLVFPMLRDTSRTLPMVNTFVDRLPVEKGKKKISPHDSRKIFNLVVGRACNGSHVQKLLMTHAADDRDVNFVNYVETHPWEELMVEMRPISDAAERVFLEKDNARTLKLANVFHGERAEALAERRNPARNMARVEARARARALREALRYGEREAQRIERNRKIGATQKARAATRRAN